MAESQDPKTAQKEKVEVVSTKTEVEEKVTKEVAKPDWELRGKKQIGIWVFNFVGIGFLIGMLLTLWWTRPRNTIEQTVEKTTKTTTSDTDLYKPIDWDTLYGDLLKKANKEREE